MLKGLFDIDGKFFAVTSKIADLMILSFLWIVGCIPVVTILTSTSSLYHTVVKCVRYDRGGVLAEFWDAYKKNLRQGVALTLVFGAVGALLGFADYQVFFVLESRTAAFFVLAVGLLILSLVYVLNVLWLVPVFSRFANTFSNLVNTYLLLAIELILGIPGSLLLALMLDRSSKGAKAIYRFGALFPVVLSVTVVGKFFVLGMANAASVQQLRAVYSSFVDELIALDQVDPVNGIQDAILYPVSIGPYGMTLENNSYHHETVNAPYSIYPLIEYYNYTLDEDFLNESLYPYLELVNNFAAHWLVKNEDGSYTLYAGYNEGSWAMNPAVELAAYKNCLRYGVKFSKQLGDDNWKTWEPILNGLADQPTVVYNGKTVLALAEKEWKGSSFVDMTSPVPADGNCIPLDAMLPGEVMGYYSSDEDLQIIQDTVTVFSDRGGWTQINNFPRLATDAVNCRYPAETVVEKFAAAIRRQMKTNMMIDDGVHGIEKAGATETVNNMMLLSDQGVIKLFGNWLAGTDAKFVRLRAPGAFVFSAAYDGEANEIVEGVSMTSEKGATATVASLWDEGMTVKDSDGKLVKLTKGTAPNHDDEITYTFDTVAGETYTFTKGETVDKSELEETIEAAEALSEDDYTAASWTAFERALTAAKDVLDSEIATQDEADEAKTALETAIAGLKTKPGTPVNPDQPNKPIVIPPVTPLIPTMPTLPFTDVADSVWYYDAIEYVYDTGLMNGVGGSRFNPTGDVTRGMVATILYRMEGSPRVASDGAFWWSDARVWAMEAGVSDGTNMDGKITREQLAAMLFRYAKTIGADVSARGNLSRFSDAEDVSNWAADAMQWAVGEGVIGGSNGRLNPKGLATRAEVAAMFMRFCKNIAK